MDAVSDSGIGEYTPMSRALSEVQKGYTPFRDGDILWAKITPCMQNGKSCVVSRLPNGYGFGSTEFHVLRTKSMQVSQAFLWEFVSQENLRNVATFAFTGSAGHQRVPASFLEDLPFPALPIDRQDALVKTMVAARSARKAKLTEAEALLAGLDGFLLTALGLAAPRKDDRKFFATTVRAAHAQLHLNAEYFHPERTLALRAMVAESARVPSAKLGKVVKFIRSQISTPGPRYLGLAHVQSNTGELVEANEDTFGSCSEFKKSDVLFARLRPYLNKVHRAEMDGCCSPEFYVLRVNHSQTLLPDYLAAILRSNLTLAQTRHMMTGNTHPRLTNEDVLNLVIPIPKKVSVQQAIVDEGRRRREEARRLRAEAEVGWHAAKRWFEEQLLGKERT